MSTHLGGSFECVFAHQYLQSFQVIIFDDKKNEYILSPLFWKPKHMYCKWVWS
jgi:hypothetical protein